MVKLQVLYIFLIVKIGILYLVIYNVYVVFIVGFIWIDVILV